MPSLGYSNKTAIPMDLADSVNSVEILFTSKQFTGVPRSNDRVAGSTDGHRIGTQSPILARASNIVSISFNVLERGARHRWYELSFI